jgi:homoserine O-acetyltransferase/O-succinyltransferase
VSIDPALFQENERTAPSEKERQYVDVGRLDCQLGGSLPSVVVAYETWGSLNAEKSNAIVICHALSGDSHATGWWERLVGPGKPIDTDLYYVIGNNVLGGCQGTTGPSSLAEDGRPYGSRFPRITVQDMVEAQKRLCRSLGIENVLAVAGGSMGGMLALEWAASGGVRKCFVTASCAAHSAMQIGFNEASRQAIMRDPAWKSGDYDPSKPPVDGLAVARMIGHLSYLSEHSFSAKFGRNLQPGKEGQFAVESYLNYQGDKFSNRFDPNSLLVLSRAIDLYDLKSLEGSTSEFLFVSYKSDWLYPSHQAAEMHAMALQAHCKSQHLDIDLPFGHDAFLLDGAVQGASLREFLGNP